MQRYTGIILSSCDANEYDRIYSFYTLEQGLARAVARGVRKPAARLAGHLEPATLSEIYVARSKGIGQITSAITISDFSNIKENFETLGEILGALKFFARYFSEGEGDKEIFLLLLDILNLTDRRRLCNERRLLIEGFWWKLFDQLGHRPEVSKCVKCANMLDLGARKFFVVKRGGISCANCEKNSIEAFSINDSQIKLLRLFFSNPLKSFVKVKIGERDVLGLEKIRKSYQKYYVG